LLRRRELGKGIAGLNWKTKRFKECIKKPAKFRGESFQIREEIIKLIEIIVQ